MWNTTHNIPKIHKKYDANWCNKTIFSISNTGEPSEWGGSWLRKLSISSLCHLDTPRRPSSVLKPALMKRYKKWSIGGRQVLKNSWMACTFTVFSEGAAGIEAATEWSVGTCIGRESSTVRLEEEDAVRVWECRDLTMIGEGVSALSLMSLHFSSTGGWTVCLEGGSMSPMEQDDSDWLEAGTLFE